MKGTLFDIKEFTVHDGPGSRITVFLKGCTLRCKWCHNPEGFSGKKQLMYWESLCSHCGACHTACNHDICKDLGRCVHACPNGCLRMVGEEIDSDDLAGQLKKHTELLKLLGGGITISGGEPLFQPHFVCELAEKLNKRREADAEAVLKKDELISKQFNS